MLEAEIKAVLKDTKGSVGKTAEKLGFVRGETLRETDVYFNGADRNFMETDEALRLRSCRNEGSGQTEARITYKGPKMDDISNSRREYETEIGDLTVMDHLLASLGYRKVFTVEKVREEWKLSARGDLPEVTLCLDEVTGLGAFLELETLAEAETAREAAVAELLRILDDLGIPRENLTKKSYLEMLMSAKKKG